MIVGLVEIGRSAAGLPQPVYTHNFTSKSFLTAEGVLGRGCEGAGGSSKVLYGEGCAGG